MPTMAPMYLTASQLAMAFFLAVPAHGFWRSQFNILLSDEYILILFNSELQCRADVESGK